MQIGENLIKLSVDEMYIIGGYDNLRPICELPDIKQTVAVAYAGSITAKHLTAEPLEPKIHHKVERILRENKHNTLCGMMIDIFCHELVEETECYLKLVNDLNDKSPGFMR